jgi:signal transduction histidine kinase
MRGNTLVNLAAGSALAALIVSWLWIDCRKAQEAGAQVLVAQGQAALHALEGGIRSHRRVGTWLRSNIDSVLESTVAATPGFLGLALFDENKDLVSSGGSVPSALIPDLQPQWTDDGLVVSLRTRLVSPEGVGGQGQGRGGPWYDEQEPDTMTDSPIWLTALLDDGPCREAASRERRRCLLWMAIALAAVALAVATASLVQHRGRLAVELGLGRERENRLEELTRLGAGLAHETKNPLSLIRGLAQSLAGQPAEAEKTRARAGQIVDEADRVVGRINSFLRYSRPAAPQIQPVDLAAIVEENLRLFVDEAGAKGIRARARSRPATVLADPDLLRQALVNLMVNALAACADGDTVDIDVGPGERDRLALAVCDTGAGIAPNDLPHVIKPYFTRREGGTGLGLAIVDQIVQAHGWRLEIESTVEAGTSVRIIGIEEAPPA